jgi:hypothetical protein
MGMNLFELHNEMKFVVTIERNQHSIIAVADWCDQNIGNFTKKKWCWYYDPIAGKRNYQFKFVEEKDATMFALRWA